MTHVIHLHIIGKVQGVWFRDSTKKKADELGIKGWVRNCSDGSVEVCAEGEADALEELEKWCWEGPKMARVEDVEKESCDPENYTTFEIVASD